MRSALIAAVVGVVAANAATGHAAPSAPVDQATAYQNDVAHDGYIADAGLSAPLTHAWSYTLPGDASYPVIVNGVVYVTAAKTLYALNQATGAQLWSRAVGGTYASPGLTYERGRVFVINSDGLLTAVDAATGSVA